MDVYVEKPLANTVEAGRRMVEAAQQNDRIVQLGTQQRASRHFQEAVRLIRDDAIGKISLVRAWNSDNKYPEGIGAPENTAPPEDLDWDFWLGPAPEHPFNPNRFGVFLDENRNYERWGTWRRFWDHGGGYMTDWGVHWLDIVQWAMDVEAPHTISSMGNKYHIQDNRETPDTLQTTYEYPGFTCVYENRLLNNRGLDAHERGILFYGTKGTMYLSRAGFRIEPQPGSDVNEMQVDDHGVEPSHHRDFLNSVKSREKPKSPVEVGHRSSTAAVLGNVAFRSGYTIEWDSEAEEVTNHADANQFVRANYRDPWSLDG
jgi:predicted dehydrogenase